MVALWGEGLNEAFFHMGKQRGKHKGRILISDWLLCPFPSPFPPRGRKNWQQTAFLPSCHWADGSCTVLPSGLGYPQPGDRVPLRATLEGHRACVINRGKTTLLKIQPCKWQNQPNNKQNKTTLLLK